MATGKVKPLCCSRQSQCFPAEGHRGVQVMHAGKGKYTFASGAEYNGNYENNVKSGYGEFKYPDGGKYEGERLSATREIEGQGGDE